MGPRSNTEERILRLAEVEALCGLKKSTIRRQELAGKFPKRVQISQRNVGWKLSELREWLETISSKEPV